MKRRLNMPGLDAETFRRKHCDRIGMEHECHGQVTLIPGAMKLDCKLCGAACEDLQLEMGVLDACSRIAEVMGVDWNQLDVTTQKLVLIEINALRFRHPANRP